MNRSLYRLKPLPERIRFFEAELTRLAAEIYAPETATRRKHALRVQRTWVEEELRRLALETPPDPPDEDAP